MYYDKQKVIDVALSQVGYHEKATNADLDDFKANSGDGNWNKYSRDLDSLSGFYNGRKNGYAWCDCFVDWCFVTAYGRAGAQFLLCQPDNSAGAGCSFSAQYFRNKGQFHEKNPQPGDQIFFGSGWNNVWHTGLVVSVGNNHVYTVEGNTTDSVGRRSYALNDSSIWGYGRPNWGTQESETPTTTEPEPSGDPQDDKPAELVPVSGSDMPAQVRTSCTVTLPVLRSGVEGVDVIALQLLLIGRGYGCGPWGPDGDFGPATYGAVTRYQREHGLEVDGIIGPETWRKLICG